MDAELRKALERMLDVGTPAEYEADCKVIRAYLAQPEPFTEEQARELLEAHGHSPFQETRRGLWQCVARGFVLNVKSACINLDLYNPTTGERKAVPDGSS